MDNQEKEISEIQPEFIETQVSDEEVDNSDIKEKIDLSDIDENLRGVVESKIKDIIKGYQKAYTQKYQELSRAKRVAELVDTLAKQHGFQNFDDYYKWSLVNSAETENEKEEMMGNEEENLSEEPLEKEIENIKFQLLAIQKEKAVSEFAEKHPDYGKYYADMLPIINKLEMMSEEVKRSGKNPLLSDTEILEIAYNAVKYPTLVRSKLIEYEKKQPPLTSKGTPPSQNIENKMEKQSSLADIVLSQLEKAIDERNKYR